ncbi:hypothetical protein [Streptomyces sp. NPDC058308]|uniref:hypothetical protein n=1 Tax=Streptomyces sp. NPDC058308 TaxID=3346440 RepID=UPI0036E4B9A6
MGSEEPRPDLAPQYEGEPVCKVCGGPVGTAIRRRKVLGVFVPVWGPGPCRNAECEACVLGDGEEPGGRAGGGVGAAVKRPRPWHRTWSRYSRRSVARGGEGERAAPRGEGSSGDT